MGFSINVYFYCQKYVLFVINMYSYSVKNYIPPSRNGTKEKWYQGLCNSPRMYKMLGLISYST